MAQKEFFPTLLYRLLEDDKSRGYIEWSPAGDAFYIKDEANFEQFLSHAFNNSKYSTFYRQLNLYGFRRRRDNSLFYHPKFIKGKPHDVGTIRRKTKREKMLITGLTGKATNTNPPTAQGSTANGVNFLPFLDHMYSTEYHGGRAKHLLTARGFHPERLNQNKIIDPRKVNDEMNIAAGINLAIVPPRVSGAARLEQHLQMQEKEKHYGDNGNIVDQYPNMPTERIGYGNIYDPSGPQPNSHDPLAADRKEFYNAMNDHTNKLEKMYKQVHMIANMHANGFNPFEVQDRPSSDLYSQGYTNDSVKNNDSNTNKSATTGQPYGASIQEGLRGLEGLTSRNNSSSVDKDNGKIDDSDANLVGLSQILISLNNEIPKFCGNNDNKHGTSQAGGNSSPRAPLDLNAFDTGENDSGSTGVDADKGGEKRHFENTSIVNDAKRIRA